MPVGGPVDVLHGHRRGAAWWFDLGGINHGVIVHASGLGLSDQGAQAFDLADRDIGVELSGSTKEELFSYWVGVFTGNSDLKFQDTNAEKQFIGRAQLKLDMAGMPFKLIGAAAATDAGYETEQAGLQSRYYYDFEIYAELGDFGGGPHVQAGVVLGDNPLQNRAGEAIDLPAGDSFAEFWSWPVASVPP